MGFRDLETGWGIPSKLAEELLAWFSFFLPKTLRSEGMIMKVCALKQCDSIRENNRFYPSKSYARVPGWRENVYFGLSFTWRKLFLANFLSPG